MKHQVLFCLSIISFLSYSSQPGNRNGNVVAYAYETSVHALASEKNIILSPEQKIALNARLDYLKNSSISAEEMNECLAIIANSMKKKSSKESFESWKELNHVPKKSYQIR